MTHAPRVSIVICTYNPDRRLLERVLGAVYTALQATVVQSEVVVVDNNSDPPPSASDLAAYGQIRVVRETTPGLTAAREAGIAAAQGEFILFVDDDNVLDPGYVTAILEEFERDPAIGLIGGSIIPEYSVARAAWLGDLENMLAIRPYATDARFETDAPPYTEHFPAGAGMAVRRRLAIEHVADCAATERIQGRRGTALSSGEDIDLALYALSRGLKLVVTGKAQLIHVIGDSRLEPEYVKRLAVANVHSSDELETKWAPRLRSPIFPMFYEPLPPTLIKLVVSVVLSPFSRKMRVRGPVFRALALRRVRGVLRPTGRFRPGLPARGFERRPPIQSLHNGDVARRSDDGTRPGSSGLEARRNDIDA